MCLHTPVIQATWEAEAGGYQAAGQPGQLNKALSQKNKKTVGVAGWWNASLTVRRPCAQSSVLEWGGGKSSKYQNNLN
jgi:hypothetical protein